jgi:hypothetical protein
MIFQSFGGRLRTAGALHPQLAAAYESSLIAPSIVVVIGNEVPREIYEGWEPMRAVVRVPRKGAMRNRIVKTLPFISALTGDPERTVTYVCMNGECR